MQRLAAAVLCGLALTASFPPVGAYPLAFVALVPLILAARASTTWGALALGWVAGATAYLTAWRWVWPTIAQLQDLSACAAFPWFVAFASYHALQLALFALAVHGAHRSRATASGAVCSDGLSKGSEACVLAAGWVLLEWAFARVIPWYLADAVAASPRLRQLADIGGVYGLSFLIMAVNGLVAGALLEPRSRRLLPAGGAMLVVAGALFYGQARLGEWSRIDARARGWLRISAVQGNLPWIRRADARTNRDAWRVYEDLTRSAGTVAADLIVWPETTLRVYLRDDGESLDRIAALMRGGGSAMLVGAPDRHSNGVDELNSAYLFVAAERPRIYHKRRLLVFGEQAPAALGWRTTGRFVAAARDSPVTLMLPQSPSGRAGNIFAPSICFEAVFPGAFNAAVRAGATFLVNLTDDSWFGDTAEPYQHLNATILRAIETRRWLIRASNSGISAFVDPTGEIVASLPLGTQGVLAHPVLPSAAITPYVRLGDWPVGLSCLLVMVSLVWRRRRGLCR